MSKPSSQELAHHGVKGMHWGVRKNTPTNANYNSSQRAYDKKNHGTAGVKRINRRLNNGLDLKTARRKESTYKAKRKLAIVGAYYASQYAKVYGPVLIQHIATTAETNRGRATVAAAMGLPSKPTNGPTYTKPNRQGVHNITTI